MSSREEQKADRRVAIMKAGLDLFVRKGYSATKISDIAREAKMSVGLLFHYFESKEKLYEELVRSGLAGTQSFMEFDREHPLEFFEETARIIFGYMKEKTVTQMFVLMGQALISEATPQSVKEIVSQVNNIEASVPLIEAGQKLGLIREGDPLALSIAFWESIQGIAEGLAGNPDLPCPDPSWIVDIIRK
jgi:AcrR family transcriptional regulator